jgi:hypothetical protein
MIKTTQAYSSMDARIDDLPVLENHRWFAKEHMRDADFVADLFYRAVQNLRSARVALAGPAPHGAR